jgi:hypothetical protein
MLKENMSLVNELGNELALAFLVEGKHADKIDSENALALIDKVKEALQSTPNKEREAVLSAPKLAEATTH